MLKSKVSLRGPSTGRRVVPASKADHTRTVVGTTRAGYTGRSPASALPDPRRFPSLFLISREYYCPICAAAAHWRGLRAINTLSLNFYNEWCQSREALSLVEEKFMLVHRSLQSLLGQINSLINQKSSILMRR